MKLHVKRYEDTRGMIRKKTVYMLEAKIELNPEEEELVKRYKLEDNILMVTEHPWEKDDFMQERKLDVGFTTKKGFTLLAYDPLITKGWEEQFTEACKNFKAALDQYGQDEGDTEQVIEL